MEEKGETYISCWVFHSNMNFQIKKELFYRKSFIERGICSLSAKFPLNYKRNVLYGIRILLKNGNKLKSQLHAQFIRCTPWKSFNKTWKFIRNTENYPRHNNPVFPGEELTKIYRSGDVLSRTTWEQTHFQTPQHSQLIWINSLNVISANKEIHFRTPLIMFSKWNGKFQRKTILKYRQGTPYIQLQLIITPYPHECSRREKMKKENFTPSSFPIKK